jgi:hypothetical protein
VENGGFLVENGGFLMIFTLQDWGWTIQNWHLRGLNWWDWPDWNMLIEPWFKLISATMNNVGQTGHFSVGNMVFREPFGAVRLYPYSQPLIRSRSEYWDDELIINPWNHRGALRFPLRNLTISCCFRNLHQRGWSLCPIHMEGEGKMWQDVSFFEFPCHIVVPQHWRTQNSPTTLRVLRINNFMRSCASSLYGRYMVITCWRPVITFEFEPHSITSFFLSWFDIFWLVRPHDHC